MCEACLEGGGVEWMVRVRVRVLQMNDSRGVRGGVRNYGACGCFGRAISGLRILVKEFVLALMARRDSLPW